VAAARAGSTETVTEKRLLTADAMSARRGKMAGDSTMTYN
jgi:hypothetical protein